RRAASRTSCGVAPSRRATRNAAFAAQGMFYSSERRAEHSAFFKKAREIFSKHPHVARVFLRLRCEYRKKAMREDVKSVLAAYGLLANAFEAGSLHAHPDLISLAYRHVKDADPRTIRHLMEDLLLRVSMPEVLPYVKTPTLFIEGADPPGRSAFDVRGLAGLLQNGVEREVCIVPKMGHYAHLFRPETVLFSALQFFSTVRRA
ncbi:MAG: alpha/beta hydrolase, partial [Patescibacteria group bacterium]